MITERIQVLASYYKRIARDVTDLGFKGRMLDLDIEVSKPQQVIGDEEKLMEKMMKKIP